MIFCSILGQELNRNGGAELNHHGSIVIYISVDTAGHVECTRQDNTAEGHVHAREPAGECGPTVRVVKTLHKILPKMT